jgi:hypothetical protein
MLYREIIAACSDIQQNTNELWDEHIISECYR